VLIGLFVSKTAGETQLPQADATVPLPLPRKARGSKRLIEAFRGQIQPLAGVIPAAFLHRMVRRYGTEAYIC
jgi:hypothetical protein